MTGNMITRWANLCENLDGGFVTEEQTPSDVETIMASFSQDVSDAKFSPTKEFLEVAYGIFNGKFFGDSLPKRLIFQVKVQPTQSYIGLASYMCNNATGFVQAVSITLNGAKTLTLHEWLEVVLHEMIHVLDYQTNPSNFTRYRRRFYDPHGYWFRTEGQKYAKYGFHVQRYCEAEIGVNDQDPKMKRRIANSVFLYMVHGTENRPMVMKMSRSSMYKNVDCIMKRIREGSKFGVGVKEIKVMTSENPNIARLSDLRMKDSTSKISWWWFTDEFKNNYGPFKDEDTIEILGTGSGMNENQDENVVESENPEDVIEDIYDNIDCVRNVTDIGNDRFIVQIP